MDQEQKLKVENIVMYKQIAKIYRDIKISNFYRFYWMLKFIKTFYNPNTIEINMLPENFQEEAVKNLIDLIVYKDIVSITIKVLTFY